jgi:hypothetical protein
MNKILNSVTLSPSLNREREATSPGSNLLFHLIDLGNLTTSNLSLEVLKLVIALGQCTLHLLADLDALVNVRRDSLEVFLAETTAGHGWSTDTDTAWGESGLITWDGVLVASNVDLLQNGLNTGTIKCLRSKVKEDHVGISSVGNELVAELLELNLECFGILNNLLLILLEFRCSGLLQSNSKGGDGVIMRSTLVAWKDREVDGTLKVIQSLLASLRISLADALTEEDHGTARATKRLVCCRRDNICVLEGAWDDSSSNKTRDVSHVNNEVCTDKIRDLPHASIINQSAVCRCTSNEDLGSVHKGILFKLVIVDDTSFEVNAVWEGFEVGRDGRNPRFCN